ncbi:MAG TPA: hypothetical protein VHM02_03105, partial [Thermoanaerobaculia bacterium]|nr:hypothetical protein [Thermoanaerobaculia bacterium]
MTRRRLPLAPLALAAALALPAAADDVYLTNGNVFEDVVARREGGSVVIQLPGGALRLPASRVERIERRDTAQTEYVARRQALAADDGGNAGDWLALARWAREHGLEQGYREAARRAAALDPDLAGLPALMESLGYVRDEGSGPWLTPDELMARRGYVRHGDSWITAGERAELLRAEAEEARLVRERREERARDRALVHLAAAAQAQAEAERARAEAERRPSYGVPVAYGVPVWFFLPDPGHGHGGGHGHDGDHGHPPPVVDRGPGHRGDHNRGGF